MAVVSFGSKCGIVDDGVYVTLRPADEVHSRLQPMAAILFDEYTKASLKLHLHASKTAGMVTWIGKGRLEAQQKFESFVSIHGGIPFESLGRDLLLPITDCYKHLGFWTRANGLQGTDLTLKRFNMRGVGRALSRLCCRILRSTPPRV